MTSHDGTQKHVDAAREILTALEFPTAQCNERSALCLLALLNLTPGRTWAQVENPCLGVTPLMDWMREHYSKEYAPNTRETIRRWTLHQFMEAGLALYNPDHPKRPINSPKTVYRIEPDALAVLRSFGTEAWQEALSAYLAERRTLVERYARERKQNLVPVRVKGSWKTNLSPGKHSELIKAVIEEFAARFVPGGELVYVGDTGAKWKYCDKKLLAELGVHVDHHGKMPDVLFYDPERDWLVSVECVTSHGPVDGKRHGELVVLFASSTAGLVYLTAFADRRSAARYLQEIAWQTEVWVADAPSHLIHFDGTRFLGPYAAQ